MAEAERRGRQLAEAAGAASPSLGRDVASLRQKKPRMTIVAADSVPELPEPVHPTLLSYLGSA